jgi:hypothetical protein
LERPHGVAWSRCRSEQSDADLRVVSGLGFPIWIRVEDVEFSGHFDFR